VEYPGGQAAGIACDLYAKTSGRSLGIFFPYDDYYFFHEFTGRDTGSGGEIGALHEEARNRVHGLYRFPRWMRYRVPNIATVAVSEKGFGIEAERFVHGIKQPITGGERHSVFLVDLVNRRLVSTGLETTTTNTVAITFKQVNPHNRAHGVIQELLGGYLADASAS